MSPNLAELARRFRSVNLTHFRSKRRFDLSQCANQSLGPGVLGASARTRQAGLFGLEEVRWNKMAACRADIGGSPLSFPLPSLLSAGDVPMCSEGKSSNIKNPVEAQPPDR